MILIHDIIGISSFIQAGVAELADAYGSEPYGLFVLGRSNPPICTRDRRGWRNWQTRSLEEAVGLSRGGSSPLPRTWGRLAQLVRANGLHPLGRRFEPYIDHMNWNNIQYYFVLIYRKLLYMIVTIPEVKFVFLIVTAIIVLFLVSKIFLHI